MVMMGTFITIVMNGDRDGWGGDMIIKQDCFWRLPRKPGTDDDNDGDVGDNRNKKADDVNVSDDDRDDFGGGVL